MAEVMQSEYEPDLLPHARTTTQREGTVHDPIVRMDHFGTFPLDDARKPAHSQRIRDRKVMHAAGRIDTWKAHRHGAESVDANSRRKYFLIRDVGHALGGDCDLVTSAGQGVSEVENVQLFPSDIRRKKLSQQKNAH
jgi:hypothetical protein